MFEAFTAFSNDKLTAGEYFTTIWRLWKPEFFSQGFFDSSLLHRGKMKLFFKLAVDKVVCMTSDIIQPLRQQTELRGWSSTGFFPVSRVTLVTWCNVWVCENLKARECLVKGNSNCFRQCSILVWIDLLFSVSLSLALFFAEMKSCEQLFCN